MRVNSVFISFFLAINLANALGFRQVVYIPGGGEERGFGFDTDHDGNQNLVLCRLAYPANIQIWEHLGYDRYVLEDTAQWSYVCGVGYLDSDSLVDMVGIKNANWPFPLYIYESPDFYSNPVNVVWQDTGFMGICGGHITDLDQDGLKEILFGYTPMEPPGRACVYENTGDNQYTLVWEDTLPFYVGISGDFDLDGRVEFITALTGSSGMIYIWECVGNNEYQLVFCDTLPSPNNMEIFSANDMDGNGKPEFLCTCLSDSQRKAWLYLYEANNDNIYEYLLIDSVTELPISIGESFSVCGDIDADGKEEIVWATFNRWHVYKPIDIHQYQKIYSSAGTLHGECRINVCDLNGNGYPEVIESWYQNGIPALYGTTIWEIEGVRLKTFSGYDIYHPGEVHPIIWEKFDPPGADSFTIFFSADSGLTYDTIATGLGTDDTVYMWTIPDVISENCKIMIWAYGPPRPGEDHPRGIAWAISQNVFAIRPPTGIDTDTRYQIGDMSLRILQNPLFSDNLKIQYALPGHSKVKLVIYNVLGQVEEVLVDGEKSMGLYLAEPKKLLPNGVYFVKLITDKKTITKKCVILK